MDQPEGYEVEVASLVCNMEKSLYGLKHSVPNRNRIIHNYLTESEFMQNPADHSVYAEKEKHGKVNMIMWVGDLIIAFG